MPRRKKCLIAERHQTMNGVGDGKCWLCHEKVGLSYQEELDRKVREVPHETKQRLIDLLHEGKTVGEATRLCDLDGLVAGQIILKNISAYHFLNTEAVA